MQSIKTRLVQNLKEKHTSNMHTQKQEEIERKLIERKVIESLGALFLPLPRRTFPLIKPLTRR